MKKKFSAALPADDQIKKFLGEGYTLALDLRSEAMGDKVAAISFARFLAQLYTTNIVMIEKAEGRTPFMLSDYKLPKGVTAKAVTSNEECEDMIDCMRVGGHDSLWVMNPYLASRGIRNTFEFKKQLPSRRNEVIVVPLTKTPYNQRRDFDQKATRSLIQILKEQKKNVTVLLPKKSSVFPEAETLPIDEFVSRIAGANCVIAGDTGASHLAAALKTPLVSLYPDWVRYGVCRMSTTITVGEWWGFPSYHTPYSFIPNSEAHLFRMSLLDEEHRFGISHVSMLVSEIEREYESKIIQL